MQTHHPPTVRGAGDRAAIICGIGAALPPTVVSNADLCAHLDTTDGAGAVVLRRGSASDPGAIGPMVLRSDGAHNDLIRAPHTVALQMQGTEVFRHAVDRLSAASTQAAGWRMEDVDRLVPHQANARITDFIARKLVIPQQRQVHNVQHVGNTGAASIPLLLAQAAAEGRIAPGHRVLLTAFGAGLPWGATTVTWPDMNTGDQHTGTPENAKESP